MDAVVLVSGGLDSCVAAAVASREFDRLWLLHVSYGQRTESRERLAFEAIADHFDVPQAQRLAVRLEHLRQIGGSALTDLAMPVSPADLTASRIPTTYVPFRNAHFLAIAVSWGEVNGSDRIVIGAVEEDCSGYPDCRAAYYDAFNRLLAVGTASGSMRVVTPLIRLTKAQIVRRGLELDAPLDRTWSCYQGSDLACGVCDSCALRLRGFARAGVEDPIPYETRPDYD